MKIGHIASLLVIAAIFYVVGAKYPALAAKLPF